MLRGIQLENLGDVVDFVRAVKSSEFVPKSMRGKEASLVACVCYGLELGLSPMQAIRGVAVVNGQPCVWGDILKGLIEASPECEYVQESFENEGDKEKLTAVCRVKRRGRPKATIRRFGVPDAAAAGLLGRDTYRSYLKRMLQMRARSWALRDQFADLLCGVMAAEEAQDVEYESIDSGKSLESGATAPPEDLEQVAELIA